MNEYVDVQVSLTYIVHVVVAFDHDGIHVIEVVDLKLFDTCTLSIGDHGYRT